MNCWGHEGLAAATSGEFSPASASATEAPFPSLLSGQDFKVNDREGVHLLTAKAYNVKSPKTPREIILSPVMQGNWDMNYTWNPKIPQTMTGFW